MVISRKQFEDIAQNIFDDLPKVFGEKIDNVHIVIEEYPSLEVLRRMHSRKDSLLGLYQGIPLTQRGSWYGMSPTIPDTILLYQKNIEAICSSENELRNRIQEVLLHEIGHYFGMTEDQIRHAMKDYL
jgi:predicted Zn-dependent protease with MMP-like domain